MLATRLFYNPFAAIQGTLELCEAMPLIECIRVLVTWRVMEFERQARVAAASAAGGGGG